ncbi:hypothetical protein Tsp_11175 [Trichinella spiralis]|uniref:hypothetical protein n=1 Tax=Trichinella spiralis TaxID=6334 RepID=UPI0001EFECB2|nr:hypothetical protein Tsp_11175 [Trichinella spiralis]
MQQQQQQINVSQIIFPFPLFFVLYFALSAKQTTNESCTDCKSTVMIKLSTLISGESFASDQTTSGKLANFAQLDWENARLCQLNFFERQLSAICAELLKVINGLN